MRKTIYLLLLVLAANVTFAQQRQVSGTVTDKANGKPLAGVTVQAGNNFTSTDDAGKFTINASVNKGINFSYSGLKSSIVRVTGNTTSVNIQMEEDRQNLDEVVVLGYSTEKKKDLKGAVTIVKVADVLKETNANILASLQGRIAGVDISSDGAPGTGTTVTFRGLSSIYQNVPPLYVVDGVVTLDINGISPNDIESIQILKDAASMAIYGARSAGGVFVITTKKGKTGKTRVTFDAFYGTKTRRNKLSMLNTQQYGEALWKGFANDGAPNDGGVYGTGVTPVIPAFIDGPANTIPAGNTDWQKEVFRPAKNMSYNLGVSKAADKSSFYFGVNYNKEEGLAVHTFYDRLDIRINTAFKVGNSITIGENLSIGYLTGNRENEGRVLEGAVVQLPIIPLYDNVGNYGGPSGAKTGDYHNPVGDLDRYKGNISKGWRTFGNVYTDIEIIKGLTYHGSIGLDLIRSGLKAIEPKYVMGSFSNKKIALAQTENSTTNLTATHTLTYNWEKKKHNLQLLAGYEWVSNKSSSITARETDFFVDDPNFINIGAGSTKSGTAGSANEYGLIGQFGKLNYSYNDRYLFGASVRRDGSSRFGIDNRYGVFPAFSAAWRISQESFFNKLPFAKNISDVKLRASWGQNGNDNIGEYRYATFYGPSVDYANYDITGSNTANSGTGIIVSILGNPNIKWEAQQQTNIGLDFGMFNNRLYVSADYYVKKAKDLLYQTILPATSGGGVPPFKNIGDIKNSGLELQVSYKSKQTHKLNYALDLAFTTNKNRAGGIGDDGLDKQFPGPHILKQGTSLAEFYGYEVQGIFQNAAEVSAAADQPNKRVGGLRFKDIDGNGKINDEDRTTLGSALPKIVFGLNTNLSYKNFDVSFFLDSKLGHKIWDDSKRFTDFLGYTANHGTILLDAWTPSNSGSKIPALSNDHAGDDKVNSSYFISKGDYLRLKSLTLGYALPNTLLKKVKISNLRFYLQFQNVLTITGFKGYDYETLNADLGSYGVSGLTSYPHSKAVTFGFNVGF